MSEIMKGDRVDVVSTGDKLPFALLGKSGIVNKVLADGIGITINLRADYKETVPISCVVKTPTVLKQLKHAVVDLGGSRT